MPRATKKPTKLATGANLGFEAQLWAAADALRNNMDAAEYKHVVLDLTFPKGISDALKGQRHQLEPEEERSLASHNLDRVLKIADLGGLYAQD